MLSILLPCLILSANYPKMTMVMVSDMFTKDVIDLMEDSFKDYSKNMKEMCEKLFEDKNDISECKKQADSILGYHFSDGSNLDKVLGKVSTKTDFLYYMGLSMKATAVDFNKLKSKMSVFYVDMLNFIPSSKITKDNAFDYINKINRKIIKRMNKAKFDGSQQSILKLGKEFIPKNNKLQKKSYYDDDEVSTLKGDISKKVSYLTVAGQAITFTDSPCNVDTLFLCDSELGSKSEGIDVKNLLVDESAHDKLVRSNFKGIKTIEYTLYLFEMTVNYKKQYQIEYQNNRWTINTRGTSSSSFSKSCEVPYTAAERFSLIAITLYVDIHVTDTSLKTYSSVNVTVLENGLSTSAPGGGRLTATDSNEIIVDATGGWDKVENPPKIILTCDESKFEVKKAEGFPDNMDVDTQSLYEYKPKKSVNVGMIVGIVIAVVVVIAIVVVVVVIVLRKKKNANPSSNEGNAGDNKEA